MSNAATSAIDEYIAGFPEPVRAKLNEMRALVRELVPAGEERISYRMPAIFLDGIVVWYGGFAHHIGLYPGAAAVAAFEPELGPYKHAKGSIQFPLEAPLPRELIARIVRFNVERNLAKRTR